MRKNIPGLTFFFCWVCLNALPAQTVDLTFHVNMTYQVELDVFHPSTDFVDIAGTFNNWGGTLTKLTDPDGDNIFSTTIAGFDVGETIEFKFRINGQWDGNEEFPGGGSNRMYTVDASQLSLMYWYNDEISPNVSPTAQFHTDSRRLRSESIVRFENTSLGQIGSASWIFEGGTPSTSTEIFPIVRYDTPGSYDVTLIVANAFGSDTLYIKDYIEIRPRDYEQIDWWNDAVFYEIFVRSFYDSDGNGIGDFRGIMEKLDYLNDGDDETTSDLGITGIWLMPINPSPSYHGYDVTNYTGVEQDYGTMADFQALLEAAHERGIRIIIDFVMNHTSVQHSWFVDARSSQSSDKRDWYSWNPPDPNETGPWGQQIWHNTSTGYYLGLFWSGMPDINYKSSEAKQAMFDIADYWLTDIGIDGFRIDAAKHLIDEPGQYENTESTILFWKEYTDSIKALKPDAFSVGEVWTSTDIVARYVDDDGLDFCFEFDLASDILRAVNDGDATDLQEQIQLAYNVYPHLQYGTFLTNHDQDRSIEVLGGNPDLMKIAANIYLTLPGIPFLYYGEEIGMFGKKPDEFIRRPMQWTAGPRAGFSSVNPWISINSNYPTYNVVTQNNNDASILNRYRQLINIRNTEIALRQGNYLPVYTTEQGVLAFTREYDTEKILVVQNLTNSIVSNSILNVTYTGLFPGLYTFEDLITESEVEYQVNGSGDLIGMTLTAREQKILKLKSSTPVRTVIDPDIKVSAIPNPASQSVTIDISGLQDEQEIRYHLYDTAGRRHCSGVWQSGLPISTSALMNGTYVLEIQTSRGSAFVKLMIQH